MNKKNKKMFLILIFLLLLLDQISKIIAIKIRIIDMSKLDTNIMYNILIYIIALFVTIRYINTNNSFIKFRTKIVICIGISGIVGNLIDKIFYKKAICFINLGNFLNLNLAYIYIIIMWIGIAAILAKDTFKFLKKKS